MQVHLSVNPFDVISDVNIMSIPIWKLVYSLMLSVSLVPRTGFLRLGVNLVDLGVEIKLHVVQ